MPVMTKPGHLNILGWYLDYGVGLWKYTHHIWLEYGLLSVESRGMFADIRDCAEIIWGRPEEGWNVK